jgi:hypothetical protein
MFNGVARLVSFRILLARGPHGPRSKASPRRTCLGVEQLEAREVLSHALPTLPKILENPLHNEPANQAERLTLLNDIASQARIHAPVAKPVLAPPKASHPPTPSQPSIPLPIVVPVLPAPPVKPPITPPVPGHGTPPISPPVPGYSAFDPTTYKLFPVSNFSGVVGPDGHYSSFSIVGSDPATGAGGVLSYIVGTPYGVPVYHWYFTAHDQAGSYTTEATTSTGYWQDSSILNYLISANPDYQRPTIPAPIVIPGPPVKLPPPPVPPGRIYYPV